MENDDDISAMVSLKQLVIKSIKECNDPELLDFIYQLLEYHPKEQQYKWQGAMPCLFDVILN